MRLLKELAAPLATWRSLETAMGQHEHWDKTRELTSQKTEYFREVLVSKRTRGLCQASKGVEKRMFKEMPAKRVSRIKTTSLMINLLVMHLF